MPGLTEGRCRVLDTQVPLPCVFVAAIVVDDISPKRQTIRYQRGIGEDAVLEVAFRKRKSEGDVGGKVGWRQDCDKRDSGIVEPHIVVEQRLGWPIGHATTEPHDELSVPSMSTIRPSLAQIVPVRKHTFLVLLPANEPKGSELVMLYAPVRGV